MAIVNIPAAGQVGVIKDLSAPDMPPNAWTDADNIRFLDGMALQFFGHAEVYATPPQVPQHLMPVSLNGSRYWVYATAGKQYAVTNNAGTVTHTDISHLTARTGVVNKWTSTSLSGIPIFNADDGKVPMSWSLNLANKFVDLANWPANTTCKSIRAFKNFLVALNVTKAGTNYPYMVKWSHPADPGTLPVSWDPADATKDAGESDLAEGSDPIVDGLQLRDSFMIYKESSIWRMDYTGGPFIFRFSKVLGSSGALNRNCIVEVDGVHVVLTNQDVIVHDGQTATSVMDKQTRRFLFQQIDQTARDKCFVFKNTFFNEVFICFPSLGSSVCDRAMVWNYKDRTVTFRDIPSLNHANFGPVDESTATLWSQDADAWASDLSVWNGGDLVPSTARVVMASSGGKLYLLDASAYFDGVAPSSSLERRGHTFGKPESIKTIRGIRPRVKGENGSTVLIDVGASDDPNADPTYVTTMSHTIGSTVVNDCLVAGRYIGIRVRSGTAAQWRLESFDVDVVESGMY